MRRQLILLTSRYPLNAGDAHFVRHEVDALAARFDKVVVFNSAPASSADILQLPDNVVYGGNLYNNSRFRAILSLASPRAVRTWAQIVRDEASEDVKRSPLRILLDCYLGSKLSANPALRRAVAEPDLHTTVYSFWGMGSGLALPWLHKVRGTINLRLHRYDFHEETSRRLPYRRALYRTADRILPVSDFAMRYLFERYADIGIEPKLTLSRLGTTDPGLLPRPPRTAQKTIVSCSNLIPLKRVDRIADALLLLGSDVPIHWVHFGGGESEAALREKTRRLSTPEIRMDIRGTTGNDEILQFYRENRVDAFVNVSSIEGVPVSAMEAMSFGIPVVATDVGGTAEIVGPPHRSGELIPADFSDRQLADAINAAVAASDDDYDPRAAWEQLCDASRNARQLASMLIDSDE